MDHFLRAYLARKITGPQTGKVVFVKFGMVHFHDVMSRGPMLERGFPLLNGLERLFGRECSDLAEGDP